MKPLFILARARRSVSTLDAEFEAFERKIGASYDNAVSCGDLIFWPVPSVSGAHRKGTHHPAEFWEVHREALESGLLSEIVIGEIGRSVFAAEECRHVDSFQDNDYMYGVEDPSSPPLAVDEDDWDDLFDDDEMTTVNPYEDRLFWTVRTQDCLNHVPPDEDTRSFGRKLLIVIGRDPESRFLDSRMGQKLRSWLGDRASVVFSSNHHDVAVIAFRHEALPSELFEQMKRLMPPRLVEDFLIVDIGLKYCTGNAPISVFAEWAERPRSSDASVAIEPPRQETTPRMVVVEKVKRRKLRTGTG